MQISVLRAAEEFVSKLNTSSLSTRLPALSLCSAGVPTRATELGLGLSLATLRRWENDERAPLSAAAFWSPSCVENLKPSTTPSGRESRYLLPTRPGARSTVGETNRDSRTCRPPNFLLDSVLPQKMN